jgi:hypothetical protein
MMKTGQIGFKKSSTAERAGQEARLLYPLSNFCFCLPRTVQKEREILLMMVVQFM